MAGSYFKKAIEELLDNAFKFSKAGEPVRVTAGASGGRFVCGLGTQVKAHVERRYGVSFERPGPRLREYVLAMKAMFRAFRQLEKPGFVGEFYRFDLLPDMWSPGAIEPPGPHRGPHNSRNLDIGAIGAYGTPNVCLTLDDVAASVLRDT